jgi:hypothetical protein
LIGKEKREQRDQGNNELEDERIREILVNPNGEGEQSFKRESKEKGIR